MAFSFELTRLYSKADVLFGVSSSRNVAQTYSFIIHKPLQTYHKLFFLRFELSVEKGNKRHSNRLSLSLSLIPSHKEQSNSQSELITKVDRQVVCATPSVWRNRK
jgi:phenylacetate-coenzyme A ligase PaaK-like adenylate-forming protein